MARPSVFNYSSHTEYLAALQNAYTSRSKKISLPQWAKKLGYSSPRSVGMIVKGQRLPTEEFLFRLSQDLNLSENELRFLELLVLRQKLRIKKKDTKLIDAEINRCNPKIKNNKKLLEESIFRYVSSWHYFVIYFLAQQIGFREDPQWIRNQLRFKLSDLQIREALECMLNLRLLRRSSKTGLIEWVENEAPYTSDDIPSDSIKRFHQSSLAKSIEALQSQDVNEREFGSIMLSMDPKKLPAARVFLREFRDKFNQKFFESGTGSVYQLNINLFSYTKPK